jgi:transposase
MTGTMTWVGLDVHARSIHAAAIDSLTGELTRAKLTNVPDTVAWLAARPAPVRAAYEAGPTGFGLFRAAQAAGIGVEVIAPGKTQPPHPNFPPHSSTRVGEPGAPGRMRPARAVLL